MKTAFVIRDIPDLDHITPIIYKFLDNKKDFVILNYEINLNLQNDFRINFLQKKFGNIKIINLYSFIDKGFLYSFLSKIFSIKYFEVNFKNLKNEKIYYFSFYKKFIIAFLKKLFFKKNSQLESIFYNKKWLKKIFKILKIKSVIIDDSFYFIYKKAQNIADVCEEDGIKFNLFPHTCYINDMKKDFDLVKKFEKLGDFPNLITNSNYRKKKLIQCGIKEKNIFVYGSARFCPEWFGILKEMTNCNIKNSKSKIQVLYFMGIYNDQDLERKLINFLSKLAYIDLTIKSHPRGIFSKKQMTNKLERNFIVDFKTPSTKLIFESDIVIGTFSSILLDAFILNKTVIYPKFLIDDNEIKILYAGKGFSIDCENNEEVSQAIFEYKENKIAINRNNLKNFMQDHVYANRDKSTILYDYLNLFKPD